RHDSLLYSRREQFTSEQLAVRSKALAFAPQPVEAGRPTLPAHVEPLPDLYARLLALTRMARLGLDDLKVLNEPARQRFLATEKRLEHVLALAEKELRQESLTDEDHRFLHSLPAQLGRLVAAPNAARRDDIRQRLTTAKAGRDEKVIAK